MEDGKVTETCKCGQPHDGWPGKDGGSLCQMCWEAECSESWWRMVEQFSGFCYPGRGARRMKLISLWEPWATLMAIGAKRIETRSRGTAYRGWLAIQASKGVLSKRNLADCLDEPAFRLALAGERLSPGCIVAVVRLVDCCPMEDRGCLPGVFSDYPELDTPQEREFGDFSEGRWAWVTEHLFRLPKGIYIGKYSAH